MKKIKELLRDKTFTRGSLFIVFNAFLLYVLYFIIKNFGTLSGAVAKGVATLLDAFWPLILGLILAYLMDPLVDLIDRKFMSRFMKLPDDPVKAEKRKNLFHFISVILTMLIVLAALVAIIYGMAVLIIGKVVFGSLSDTFRELMSGFSGYETVFRNWIATNVPKGFASEKLAGLSGTLMNWIGDNVNATSVIGFFTSIGGSVVNVVIAVIISIYLLKDKQRFLRLWRKFLHLVMPQKGHAVLTETMSEINGVLSRFIRGALLDALIIALLSATGLSVMGLDAAVFIGIFAGIANVIPYFGPVLGMIPAFLMGLCTGGFWHGALAVIILVVIQQIDANFIYPKVVGSSTGLHPLAVLLAVSVFGYFGGILGMLLAVPGAGVIQVFVLKWANSREARMKKAPDAESASSDNDGDDAPADDGDVSE